MPEAAPHPHPSRATRRMKRCPICGGQYPDDARFCPNDGGTLRAEGKSDLVGEVIADRYHILKKLGEGGMGQVYLAEHVKMGRRDAIKVMGAGMASDPEAISRFNREAANAARISHPNVCTIYDFGEYDGLIYLAMEFVEGVTLTKLLAQEGPLPLPRAAAILAQVGDALGAAHEMGIVHRDLKPDNIMIVRQRDRDVVKVVDFGIAKAMGAGEAGQKVTKTGLVVGTPEYMSPEQLVGDAVDGRSDLYSLALVAYRMLTGKLPFEGATGQEMLFKRLTTDPLPLAAVRPDLTFPPGLQPVLDRALRRTPSERQPTPVEFAHEFGAAIGLAEPATLVAPPPTLVAAAAPTAPVAPTVPPTQVATPRGANVPAPVPAAPARSRGLALPLAGVALAVVVTALVLVRGRLGGGEGPATPPAVLPPPAGGTDGGTTTTPAGGQEPAPPSEGRPADRGTGASGGTTPTGHGTAPGNVTPAGGQGTPTPAGPVPPTRPQAEPAPTLPDPEEISNPATREAARRRAEAIYGRTELDRVLRAGAAATVSSAALEGGNVQEAYDWLQRAYDLNPKDSYRRQLDAMRPQLNPKN